MGCLLERDDTWNITWPTTSISQVAIQKCPGGSEAEGMLPHTALVNNLLTYLLTHYLTH